MTAAGCTARRWTGPGPSAGRSLARWRRAFTPAWSRSCGGGRRRRISTPTTRPRSSTAASTASSSSGVRARSARFSRSSISRKAGVRCPRGFAERRRRERLRRPAHRPRRGARRRDDPASALCPALVDLSRDQDRIRRLTAGACSRWTRCPALGMTCTGVCGGNPVATGRTIASSAPQMMRAGTPSPASRSL